jgi:wobble nucleotide-excising tRNase
MPVILKNLRAMSGMGILADHTGKSPHVLFRRYNLLYGFNGSGKSTLSRMFASLQAGTRNPRLPAECKFDIELDDGSTVVCPDKLNGLERRVLVFNTDFVEENLQWSSARAKPVFYIGKEQAQLADKLAADRARMPASIARIANAADAIKAADKALAAFRRERARQISDRLRLRNRKYEAPALKEDYLQLELDDQSLLDDAKLDEFTETCRLDNPPATIDQLTIRLDDTLNVLSAVRDVCRTTPSSIVLSELQDHPEMLVWVMQGHEYHQAHGLKECLFCTNTLSSERMEQIKSVLDGGVDKVVAAINARRAEIDSLDLSLDVEMPPDEASISKTHMPAYRIALAAYNETYAGFRNSIEAARTVLDAKRQTPGISLDDSEIPDGDNAERIVTKFGDAVNAINAVIAAHNRDAEDFARIQEEARLAIIKHYLAEGSGDYLALQQAQDAANAESRAADAAHVKLRSDIETTENSIREHRPAADAINKLLHSYLGHPELAIASVETGYEIQRNGKRIHGLPSEGEKTAIALCYFLSTLESERRETAELIVVVDDPISSLDSRSLNFACNLIKSRLSEAAQLFVLTHNQNCLNEFRKSWKSKARTQDGKQPIAALLFLDVTMPEGANLRISRVVELPHLLREYESEYHYLFHHVLKFDAAGGKYDYAYMMPNVLRRVLEVFLAFRCPGTPPSADKIDQLCRAHPALDRNRAHALERLTQIESHSDNLDDLIAFSSMTLEETRDATAALLAIIEHVDPAHLVGLRKICAAVA